MGAERASAEVRPEPGRVSLWYSRGHCRGCMVMLLKYSVGQISRRELSLSWTEDILAAFDSFIEELSVTPLRGDWRERQLDLAACREAKAQYMADAASDFMRDLIAEVMRAKATG